MEEYTIYAVYGNIKSMMYTASTKEKAERMVSAMQEEDKKTPFLRITYVIEKEGEINEQGKNVSFGC